MKTSLSILSLAFLISTSSIKAQDYHNKNKHEIRVSISDGLTQNIGHLFGVELMDALLGTKRETSQSFGLYSLGYRYSINRFRIGGDISFISNRSKLSFAHDKTASLRQYNLSFMILPTVEFQYYKKGIFELYGSAAGGLDLTRTYYKIINNGTYYQFASSSISETFAWQVNPIAIRLGNSTLGGFLEAGLGHKGFFTAGMSVRF